MPADQGLHEPSAEFSRVVEVGRIGEAGLHLDLEAGAAERVALAERFGLLGVESLVAQADLRLIGGTDDIRLRGSFAADVIQSCVVTLEPVPAHLAESFELVFSPRAAALDEEAGEEVQVAFDADGNLLEEPLEPLTGGRIDVGEAVAEQLALALDPYPRKPDALLPNRFAAPPGDGAGADRRESPFAVLQRLKGGRDDPEDNS